MKPLLVFGLRGTLVERIHVRSIPAGMPQPDLTVGLSKVWLRPHMLRTLLALQPHCRLALWSSTTQRNTSPLVEAVFNTPRLYNATDSPKAVEENDGDGVASSAPLPPSPPAAAAEEKEGSERRRRFSSRCAGADAQEGEERDGDAPVQCPVTFEFIWAREYTGADGFRRRNAVVRDDAHATVKDLGLVFKQFPSIAQPHNTILIDDTPSKGKLHADNALWLDTCEGLKVRDTTGMLRLQQFVLDEVCKAKDVRELLPRRIRGGS